MQQADWLVEMDVPGGLLWLFGLLGGCMRWLCQLRSRAPLLKLVN